MSLIYNSDHPSNLAREVAPRLREVSNVRWISDVSVDHRSEGAAVSDVRWRDPLWATVLLLSAASCAGTAAWALRGAGQGIAGSGALLISALAMLLFCVVAGRALLRDYLVSQWEFRRRLRRELVLTEARTRIVEATNDLLCVRRGLDDAYDVIAAELRRQMSMVHHGTDVVLICEQADAYVVRAAAGHFRGLSRGIAVGKRCPADRELVTVVERLSPHFLLAPVGEPDERLSLALLGYEAFAVEEELVFGTALRCFDTVTRQLALDEASAESAADRATGHGG